MHHDDMDGYVTQRAAQILAPMAVELAAGLGIDLLSDRARAARMISDLGRRMFEAGYSLGSSHALADLIEQPSGVDAGVVSHLKPGYDGPLGEDPRQSDWDPTKDL